MNFILKFTPPKENAWGKRQEHAKAYYFVRLGLQWPHDPSKRLIDETTPDLSHAKEFGSTEDARTVLARAGSPTGWTIEENEN